MEDWERHARQSRFSCPLSPTIPPRSPTGAAWELPRRWTKPFLTAFSDSDPVTRGADRLLQSQVPGAKDQPHTTITGGGHFLQEDKGEELAHVVVDFIAKAG
jgi:haloalkane dehalogenase